MARLSWSATCAPPSALQAEEIACESVGCAKNSGSAEAPESAGNQAVELLAYLVPLAVVLCGAASVARASCALQLDGDPEVVGAVRDAVDAFREDGVACVDVRALCSRDDAAIVVDLRDQLGRSVQRRFTTPDGAAAFLISWSRRPLPQSGTGLEPSGPPRRAATPPGATPPGATPPSTMPRALAPPSATPPATTPPSATTPGPGLAITAGIPGLAMAAVIPGTATAEAHAASAPFDFIVHPELRTAYISAPFGAATADGMTGVLEAAFLFRHGTTHFGVNVRGIAASVSQRDFLDTVHLNCVELDAEAILGWRWQLNRIALGSDLFAGVGAVSVISQSDSPIVEVRTRGLRGGGRIAVESQLLPTVWFDVRMGWDGLRQVGVTGKVDEHLQLDHYLGQVHLEIGLLWAP